jgi:hypothetical protein
LKVGVLEVSDKFSNAYRNLPKGGGVAVGNKFVENRTINDNE